MEIWKEYVCTIDKTGKRLLEVSTHGRRRVTSIKTGKILKLDYGSDNGYKVFGGFGKAHRVVALAFIPNTENKPYINHRDGDRSNNNISNLEWATQSENIQHAFDNGLAKGPLSVKRSEETKQKISKANQDNIIYHFYNKNTNERRICTQYTLRKEFNLHQGNLSQVCSGDRRHHKGWVCEGSRFYEHWFDNCFGISISTS